MKKPLLLTGLTLIILALIITACRKFNTSTNALSDKINVVFAKSDPDEITNQPFSILKDHTKTVEEVGYNHHSLSSLRSNLEFQELSRDLNLDLEHITRKSFDGTPVQMLIMPFESDPEQWQLYAYTVNNQFEFVIGRTEQLERGYRKLSIMSVDKRDIYYETQISPEGRLGRLKVYNTASFPDLSYAMPPVEDKSPPGGGEGCCSLPFDRCLSCFVQSCSDDWKCMLMCSWGPGVAACLAAWAIACITNSGCTY